MTSPTVALQSSTVNPGISWNGSTFVLFESYPTTYFHTSPDGITWARHATALGNLVDIVWNGTHFIAPSNGSVYSSTDGIDWTDLGDPGVNLVTGEIIWDGSRFVGVGQNGLISTSDDGLAWRRAKNQPTLSVSDADCGAWEKSCIYQPWLLEHENKFYNFYNAAQGGVEQTGLAFSTDLLNQLTGVQDCAVDKAFITAIANTAM